jgi:RNA polymerase sigma-70 factor (ECF subfamily)
MDEFALIQSAKQGELESFNRLVLEYQDTAFNLAYRMLDDPAQAEDAVQTAFISAYRSLSSYRGGSFRAWVLRMVTNACYDELRRRHRHPTQSLEPVDEESQEEIESPAWMVDPGQISPEEELTRRELQRAIQECLQHLPEDFRAVIVLVDVEGLDYQDASRAAGKPLGTIKSRVARARMRMRNCLQNFKELFPAEYRQTGETRT